MTGRAARIMRRACFALLAFVAVVLIAAVIGILAPRPLTPPAAERPLDEPVRRILVLSNPIHTDIALPADPDVLARFSFLGDDGLPIDWPDVEWLVFGWGGRSFYLETPTWADLRPGPVLRAFTLDRSAMHVAVTGPIPLPQDDVQAIDLSPDAFGQLVEHVSGGFMLTGQGAPILIEGRSYGEYDLFYEGAGWFNALAGCNLWSAAALRAAGLRTGWWNPLPQSLIWSLRLHNPLAHVAQKREPVLGQRHAQEQGLEADGQAISVPGSRP